VTGTGDLERRYRRLLVFYPRRYRRRHADEIVAVLLDGASAGQRRPRVAEAASLAWSGLGMRLRPNLPRSAHTVRTAVRLMYLGALVELGVLAVVAATVGRLHAAILTHNHGFTAAQWQAEFHQHIVPLEIGAPIAACVWIWLAWANGRGHGWARALFLVFAALTTASLLSGLAGGAFVYAPADAVAGIALCVVALTAVMLIINAQSRPYYSRIGGRLLRSSDERRGGLESAAGSRRA
jgi:hypothetical protein